MYQGTHVAKANKAKIKKSTHLPLFDDLEGEHQMNFTQHSVFTSPAVTAPHQNTQTPNARKPLRRELPANNREDIVITQHTLKVIAM